MNSRLWAQIEHYWIIEQLHSCILSEMCIPLDKEVWSERLNVNEKGSQ